MNTSLSPDQRADLVIKEMTLDEKVALLHGVGMPTDEPVTLENAPSNRGCRLCGGCFLAWAFPAST